MKTAQVGTIVFIGHIVTFKTESQDFISECAIHKGIIKERKTNPCDLVSVLYETESKVVKARI